jgi:transcriptional regulator of acetoin/glycerol metabolism
MEKKITTEELDALVNANRVYRDLKFNLADIEMNLNALNEQKDLTIPRIKEAHIELAKQQQVIYDKYGDVSVNLQTGEYN